MLAHGLTGCADRVSLPTTPTTPITPATPSPSPIVMTPTLVVFTEPRTGFSTSEVRDVQEQILQFTNLNELIWAADGTRLPGYRVGRDTYGDTPTYYIEGKI